MIFIWFILMSLFLLNSRSLLLSLLLLEMLGFFVLFILSNYLISIMLSDFMLILMFSVFVMEGVMGLVGLLLLVSFSGTDYVSSSSVMKF